jgi:hypothetical protein
MRTKILAAFVAGGLLVGAGFLASVVSSPGTAQAQARADGSGDDRGRLPRLLGFLGEVLDDLVDEGTISQGQADAIVEATEDRASELEEGHLAIREGLSDALADDVLTEEEASSVLPDDHWLFGDAFEEAWADGQLTADEIREARPHRDRPFHRGFRFGAFLDSLPDDHPLGTTDLSEYLDDGLITPEEIREAFETHQGSRFGDDS